MRTLAKSKVLSFFYLFFLVLIRLNKERKWVQDFLLLPQGFESFRSDLSQTRWSNLVRVECLQMIKLMVVGFCYIGGWCDSGCEIWEHFHSFRDISRVVSRLYRWVYKTLRFSPLTVELSVVVMTGFPVKTIPDWILWVAKFRFPFYEICVQDQWGHKVLRS